MAVFRSYFIITCILLVAALIASAICTWTLQNTSARSQRYYPGGMWPTLGFIAFIGWSTLIITGLQALFYQFGWWERFIREANAMRFFKLHLIYMAIYTIFWLSAAGAITSFIPQHCDQIENCPQAQAGAGFAWIVEICFVVNLLYLFIVRYRINNGSITVDLSPGLPTTVKQKQAAPAMQTTNGSSTPSHLIEKLCLQCKSAQCVDGSVYCGPNCVVASRNGAPKLVELPAAHYMFRRISDMLKAAWTHPTGKPTPQHIFVIVSTEDNDRMYKAYKEGVESQRRFLPRNMTEGNEQYRWHGTTRECKVGDPGQKALCTSASCPMCCIMRHSYDVDKFGPRWGRFGKGVYCSATSSKSNDYSKNLSHSPWTALLLNSVVVGNPYNMYDNSPQQFHPPDGYDSIIGQPGRALNYDETIVYRNDAIRPVYLILYLTPRASSG
ncbi:hypothetical protein M408DRAFT_329525 [Serendipita vermifera MAFF 305830]|uniref:PARP catalytic domain-containing protein n=2 Tax=Serendipita vermifera MAFF 305830 TaxID=933852 RepID=A0A0C2WQK3_SERVB|nr:hypothetical protein M408DRAFT_329525 [Serendipita vermifera MAFF 305830]